MFACESMECCVAKPTLPEIFSTKQIHVKPSPTYQQNSQCLLMVEFPLHRQCAIFGKTGLHPSNMSISSHDSKRKARQKQITSIFCGPCTSGYTPVKTAASVHVTQSNPPSLTACTAASKNGAAEPYGSRSITSN